MKEQQINQYAKKIHAQNVERGWWDDPKRCLVTCLQLVNTEVAEATEADRKNLYDDHLPQRKGAEVELADALIRILDFGGKLGLVYDACAPHPSLRYCKNLASKHLVITAAACVLGLPLLTREDPEINRKYSLVISTIITAADQENYNIWAAVDEKLEYNKTRQDHDRDYRAKNANGKKY